MGDVATAEDIQTITPEFDSPADEIADLLLGDDEADNSDNSDESKEDENLAKESTEEETVDESEEESTEESIEESTEDTWGGVLGVPEDAIAFDEEGNVTGVNVKVNGKLDTVSMADLIKDYQGGKSYTEKSQTLASERKIFDDAKLVVEQEYASKLENVETITNYLSNKLVAEFEGINWDQLRVENPAEYAAARQDYSARAQELKQAQDAVSQEKEQATTANTQKMQESQKAYMQAQFSKMVETNPTWSDETVRLEAMTGLKSFASNQYGFGDQEFSQVQDARLIELLKDAKAYHEGVKVATAKRKKLVPKFQKSKGKGTKRVSKLDKLTKAASSAKGGAKRTLQVDAVTELLTGTI